MNTAARSRLTILCVMHGAYSKQFFRAIYCVFSVNVLFPSQMPALYEREPRVGVQEIALPSQSICWRAIQFVLEFCLAVLPSNTLCGVSCRQVAGYITHAFIYMLDLFISSLNVMVVYDFHTHHHCAIYAVWSYNHFICVFYQ